jgi:predicted lipoprotein with Yx(FWY)xxD motif
MHRSRAPSIAPGSTFFVAQSWADSITDMPGFNLRQALGKKMWAYKGHPLYAWKNDKAPGETDGDGKLNGAWHVATP